MVHSFGLYEVKAHQEAFPCVSGRRTSSALRHASSSPTTAARTTQWFVVPKATFDGPDGYFDCEERGFDDYAGALNGASPLRPVD
ncbi:MAG: hypothetical protein R3B09_11720 [Nannocystaceae bacterium]